MVAGMVVVVSLVGGRAGAGVNPRTQRAETRIYVVRPGDTVWSIAQGIEGPGADPRALVDRLIAANHVANGIVRVGDRLEVPADA